MNGRERLPDRRGRRNRLVDLTGQRFGRL